MDYIEVNSIKDFDITLKVPTSKSYANRLLILAAIKKESVRLNYMSRSTDVLTMIKCLKAIGLDISEHGDSIIIKNSFPDCESNTIGSEICLDSGDGGTTNRFLISLLARGKKTYLLNASGGMRSRPMDEVVKCLRSLNVDISEGSPSDKFWIKINGPMNLKSVSKIYVDSSRSTQFATSMALSLADTNINVDAVNVENSKKYFDLTTSLVLTFKELSEYNTPVDFSSLSYPIAAALALGKVNIQNCFSIDKFQADSILIDLVDKFGGKFEFDSNGLHITCGEALNSVDLDCSGFPDLVPTLAFISSYASGISVLRNLSVLRHKESNRVDEVIKVLQLFGIKYELNSSDDLKIYGNENYHSDYIIFDAPEDHRIIMMAYLFMIKNRGGKISNYIHVNKSFPDFFRLMKY